eukprot:scaffold316_cov352-Pavlova_lutheri.AAC.14
MALLQARTASFQRFKNATRRCTKVELHRWRVRGVPSSSGEPKGSGERAPSTDEGSTRRTVTVEFTCDVCGTRNSKKVNPKALVKGTVYVQCEGCEKYHRLVDNLDWWGEEFDLRNERIEDAPNEE